MDFKNITNRFNDLGLDFVSATQSIDTTTSGGRFMQDIFMAFAEFERNIISERTRESMYQRAQQGHSNGGHSPLGYNVKEKKLEINSEEAELVNKIYDYYIENPSCLEVARRLDQEGKKMKSRTLIKKNEDDGKIEIKQPSNNFTKSNILDILSNRVYVGLRKYHEEYFTGIHKPIISQEKFDKVQKLLEAGSQYTQTYRKSDSSLILLGVTKCGFCGSTLTTSSGKGGQYYYYKCSRQAHLTKDQCQAKQLPFEMLENFAIQTIVHLAESSSFLEVAFKQIQFNKGDELKILEDELTNLRSNKTKLETLTKNMTLRMANDKDVKNSKKYLDPIEQWQGEIDNLEEEIRIKTRYIKKMNSSIGDRQS